MKTILETGGSKSALDLFVDFRGRAKIDPLLTSLGLNENSLMDNKFASELYKVLS